MRRAPLQSKRAHPTLRPRQMRSAQVAAMPRYGAPGRGARIARRLLTTFVLLGGLAWLFQAIRRQALGDGRLAQMLYRAHDELYLPLKGYTLTLFYPTSLIWYGLLLSLLLLWLMFFLVDRSVVRRPQMWLLHRLVGSPIARPVLLFTARLLLRYGLPPSLLVQVAEYERDRMLNALASGSVGQPMRLVRVTRLLIELRMLSKQVRLGSLLAACDWYSALLLLRMRGEPALLRLAPLILQPCERALLQEGLTLEQALAHQDGELGMVGCLADTVRAALIAGAALDPQAAQLSERQAEQVQAGLQRALAWSAVRRREQVDRLRAQFEQVLAHPFGYAASGGNQAFLANVSADSLPLLGRLALTIDLSAAYENRSGEQARAAIESIEALWLVLECLGSNVPTTITETANKARMWLSLVPAPLDYQIVASIAINGVSTQALAWEAHQAANDDVFRRADAELSLTRVDSLFWAAGPMHETHLLEQRRDEDV